MMKSRVLTIGLALLMAAAASAPGCVAPNPGDLGGNDNPDPNTSVIGTKPVKPPQSLAPPKITQYKRGSLPAPYLLLSRDEYGRINENNIPFSDADYTTQNTGASAASKLGEIQGQINRERTESGITDPIAPIISPADEDRAQLIPFRGNPSDVKYTKVNGVGKAYVPLGGDVTTPGNEVTVVRTDGNMQLLQRITVGVRPQRLAIHPAGGLIFVCNQYSNYISIIDASKDELLKAGGKPVEIPTEYYCADVLFVQDDGVDTDKAKLYVANRWRHSVLEYQVNIQRSQINGQPDGIEPVKGPTAEIFDVGNNPYRLTTNDQQNAVYVANNKGGEVAKINVADHKSVKRIAINGASTDIVAVADLVFIPTTTVDRGLPSEEETLPRQISASPVKVTGMDGKQHEAHPGALKDKTKSYNFEDLRNGIVQIEQDLNEDRKAYLTDDVSSEPNFDEGQKVVHGAVPTTIIRNSRGDRVYVALGATDTVQEFEVIAGAQFALRSRQFWQLDHRPFGLALDEENNRLFVADWASEKLEVLDTSGTGGRKIGKIDLDYAQPPYPATTVEVGERFFYEATWSNNGRKSCATCHVDELDTDGVGYANGATAPTSYHQVKPNHNLAQSDSYFWNGSFGNGNYTSLAFAAQTRPNCQLIEFGFIDGVGSDPRNRIGDRNNLARTGDDLRCRPQSAGPGTSRINNQAEIDRIVAQGVAIMDQRIRDISGLERRDLARAIDAYSVAELRLPPNPLKYAIASKQVDQAVTDQRDQGAKVFQTAGCATCHNPQNARAPFSDGKDHGAGAGWLSQFIRTYQNDARIQAIVVPGSRQRGFQQTMLAANKSSTSDPTEINQHVNPIDFFVPFCFQADNCVQFNDPLEVRGSQEETNRIDLLIQFNLGDPDRTFIPGNVMGQAHINTPSLRGVWTQANVLHHGLAHTVQEAILAPGHPALEEGEVGWAISGGTKDVHGKTSGMSKEDVAALVRYVENIE